MSIIRDYVTLIKPRIAVSQLVSLGMGCLAAPGPWQWSLFATAALATFCAAAAAGCWNQVLEKGVDSRMKRTAQRPIPTGRISRVTATLFGLLWFFVSMMVFRQLNPLVLGLAVLTVGLYVCVYTPLKELSWLNTLVGAIPGALLPLGGYAAMTGMVSFEAWLLALVMFLWQLPHFYAIAWLYREDYLSAGLKMMSTMDINGAIIGRQMMITTVLMGIASLAPVAFSLRIGGWVYGVGVIGLAGMMGVGVVQFWRCRSDATAKLVLKQSVLYLVGLVIVIGVNRWFIG